MIAALLFLGAVLGIWTALAVFYTLYLAAINLWENRHETTKTVLVVASPILLVMGIMDILMQFTLACVIFADFPRDLLVTQRLKRYRATGTGWRKHWAEEICMRALNPFAPGRNHC